MSTVLGFVCSYHSGIARLGRGGDDRLAAEPTEVTQPVSYLVHSPSAQMLYAVREVEDGRVDAYGIDNGRLLPRGDSATGGSYPCHASLHRGHLLVANYGSGTVSVHRLAADGSLAGCTDLVTHSGSGPDPERQQGPHAHMVLPDRSGDHVLVTDLGTDLLHRYRWDEGKLRPADSLAMPPGSGPRHLALHPEGRYAYVVGELDSTVTVVDLTGPRVVGAVPVLPGNTSEENAPSGITLSADARHCFVANRGHDSIAVLALADGGASLRLLQTVTCGGSQPRDLVRHGERLYVANQHSDLVVPFRIDEGSGALHRADWDIRLPAPSTLVFLD